MKILGSPLAPGKFFTLGDVVGRVEIRMEMEKSEENDVTTPAPCGTELQSWLQCAKNATHYYVCATESKCQENGAP